MCNEGPAVAPDRGGIAVFHGSTSHQPPRQVNGVVRGQDDPSLLDAMTLRLAAMYARPKDFVIQPESRTTAGVWIGSEPVQVLANESDIATVALAVRTALAASRDGVAHPTDWKAVLQPLLNGAKIKSWNALQKSAKMVGIEMSDVELRILSSRNGGTSGDDKGYHSLPETAIVLATGCSDEELGSALRQALSLCC
jgi:hypothetical protein